MTVDKMVGWHHRLSGHEFEQAPGDGEGQGSLVCCSPWAHKDSDATEQLNNNNDNIFHKSTAHLTFKVHLVQPQNFEVLSY